MACIFYKMPYAFFHAPKRHEKTGKRGGFFACVIKHSALRRKDMYPCGAVYARIFRKHTYKYGFCGT